jgi:hypothetical protein
VALRNFASCVPGQREPFSALQQSSKALSIGAHIFCGDLVAFPACLWKIRTDRPVKTTLRQSSCDWPSGRCATKLSIDVEPSATTFSTTLSPNMVFKVGGLVLTFRGCRRRKRFILFYFKGLVLFF